jgi:hypothetical protein
MRKIDRLPDKSLDVDKGGGGIFHFCRILKLLEYVSGGRIDTERIT